FATSDVTATAGSDYASRSGTASILAGRTSVTINVPVYGDTTFEPDETFKLTLSNLSSNAQFTRAEAIGTIRNDDAPPPVLASINDVQVTEGNDGVANAVFTVSLDKAALVPVSVDFYTYGLTATPGYDYQAQFGTLTIPAGATSGTITVPVYGDVEVESNETFELNIYNATGGSAIADGTGIGTIVNDDAFSRLSVADIRVAEGNSGTTMANFTVNLDQPNNGDISLWYYTYDMSASSYLDYEPPFAQLTIPAGATSGTISIPIYGDTQVEPDETFQLWIYGVSSNAVLDNSSAICTIVNDDVPASISIANASISEGNNSWKNLTFTLTRTGDLSGYSSVIASTVSTGYTATGGNDFQNKSSTVGFNPGETSKTFNVRIYGDTTAEPDETFGVRLSNPYNAGLAVDLAIGTIINDDGGGTMLGFSNSGGGANYYLPPDALDAAGADIVLNPLPLPGSRKLRTIV
ncbi:MAG: Calx-beta domain-containing protein, partial [bacterium]